MPKASLPFGFSMHWGKPVNCPAEMAFHTGAYRDNGTPEHRWVNRYVVHGIAGMYGLGNGWSWFFGFHRFGPTTTRTQIGDLPRDAYPKGPADPTKVENERRG